MGGKKKRVTTPRSCEGAEPQAGDHGSLANKMEPAAGDDEQLSATTITKKPSADHGADAMARQQQIEQAAVVSAAVAAAVKEARHEAATAIAEVQRQAAEAQALQVAALQAAAEAAVEKAEERRKSAAAPAPSPAAPAPSPAVIDDWPSPHPVLDDHFSTALVPLLTTVDLYASRGLGRRDRALLRRCVLGWRWRTLQSKRQAVLAAQDALCRMQMMYADVEHIERRGFVELITMCRVVGECEDELDDMHIQMRSRAALAAATPSPFPLLTARHPQDWGPAPHPYLRRSRRRSCCSNSTSKSSSSSTS